MRTSTSTRLTHILIQTWRIFALLAIHQIMLFPARTEIINLGRFCRGIYSSAPLYRTHVAKVATMIYVIKSESRIIYHSTEKTPTQHGLPLVPRPNGANDVVTLALFLAESPRKGRCFLANVTLPTKTVACPHASFHAKGQNVQHGVQSTSYMESDTVPKLLESKTTTSAGCCFTDSFIHHPG